jgi:hypothetical protein
MYITIWYEFIFSLSSKRTLKLLFNIGLTVHLVYIRNQDQLDAQSLLKTLTVVLH